MEKKKTNKFSNNIEINNRKAKFDYYFVETYVAGIVLTGTEIKSIRLGKASLVDCFCYVTPSGEMMLKGSYIAKYENQGYMNHEERRERKLLLKNKEIKHLQEEAKNASMTIVPIKMFINQNGLCKVLIALAKGKKDYDKRESIKQKDAEREMNRFKKSY